MTFLDNHDTWRIMYDDNLDGDVWRLRPALTFLYTSLHIPCLYYGTEQGFNGGTDPYNRENMFDGGFEWGPSEGDAFRTNSVIYQFVRQLNQFREAYPALTVGTFAQRWQTASGPGIYAYTKTLGTEEVLVVLNTSADTLSCTPVVTRPNGTVYVNLFNPTETATVSGGTLNVSVLGHDQKLFATQRPPLWVGNLTTWPGPTHTNCPGDGCNPTLDPGEDLWVDVETRPIRDGQAVNLFYRILPDGPWTGRDMGWNANSAEGSFWNVNLGPFPAGATIEYYVRATEVSEEVFANNSGANYTISVTSETTPPFFAYAPLTIVDCHPVTIFYQPHDGPLAGAAAIYGHIGFNGWSEMIAPAPALTYGYDPLFDATGWRVEIQPPPGSTEINIVFNDGDATWDNNNGNDGRIGRRGAA